MKTEQAIRKLGQTLWDILGREYIDKYCEDKNGNLVSVSSISVEDIAEELVNAGYGDMSEYKSEIEKLKSETSNIRRETAKEIYEKTKEKDSYLLVWEYGEGYLDCLKNLREVISEYGVEV